MMRTTGMAKGVWALAWAGAALTAQAQGSNSAWIADGSGQTTVSATTTAATIGTPTVINLNTWTGSEANFALASGETQTLRGLSAAAGHADGRFHMQGGGRTGWTTEVRPGNSGLSVGDPITVYFDVRVDGSFDTRLAPFAGASPDYHVSTLAYMTLRYGVSDVDLPGYDPESDPGLLFRYGGQAAIEAGDVAWSSDKVLSQTFNSTATATLQDGSVWEWAGNTVGGTQQVNVPPSAQINFSVDTGVQRFAFETIVGHHLFVDGYHRTEAFGLNEGGLAWASLVDFAHTFDVELVSSVPGVEFSHIAPGVAQGVPEPATWALMFVGVAALLRRVRGQGAADAR